MSQCNQCCCTPCECMDGDETERAVTTNTDPEAIARRIVEFDARYQATRSLPLGSSERRDAFLSAMQSSIDDAPALAAAYLDLRAQLDAARADNARLRGVAERQSRGRRAALTGLLRMARRKVPSGPVAAPVPLDVQAAHEREVSELYATVASVTAERDAAQAEAERLRDIIRHNAPVVVGVCSPMVNAELDKRDAEIARLTAEVGRMTALYRKADDGHDENMRETARLIGEVERLTAREPGGLDALRAELTHARRKFPGGARLIEALCEELGEAAREERPDAAGNREWLQVACVAMRLYEEGCPDAATSPLLPALRALEAPARAVLVESGND